MKTYKDIIKEARERGVTTERAMDASIDSVSELLVELESSHPELHHKFMRKVHEDLYGPHYDDHLADCAVSKLEYTDENGKKHTGPHWTKDEVLSATHGKTYPVGTTDADKYVAYNAAYADFCRKFDDDDILDIAYLFFFADQDWHGAGKVWTYMQSNA